MFQSKEYKNYPLENIAYTPIFLGLYNILIQVLRKKLIMTLKIA
jgi:hypothetical protein